MKKFAYEHPIAFSLIGFVITFIFGMIAGSLFGLLMVNMECIPQGPGDPCDGPAMMAFATWIITIPASVAISVIVGLLIFFYYKPAK